MDPACLCKDNSYRMDCPYTFEQGGGKFHCLGGDLRAVHASAGEESEDSWEAEEVNTGSEGYIDMLKRANVQQSSNPQIMYPEPLSVQGGPLRGIERELKMDPRTFHLPTNQNYAQEHGNPPGYTPDSADDFLAKNRTVLRKFEALQINGKSINDYTIGGFKLDVQTTSKKVKAIAPLPPNALPKIFIDDNLNFYHHFFKGMEILLGGGKFQEIVDSKIHHEGTIEDLPTSIIGFMESGMCVGDSSLTLLVKKSAQ